MTNIILKKSIAFKFKNFINILSSPIITLFSLNVYILYSYLNNFEYNFNGFIGALFLGLLSLISLSCFFIGISKNIVFSMFQEDKIMTILFSIMTLMSYLIFITDLAFFTVAVCQMLNLYCLFFAFSLMKIKKLDNFSFMTINFNQKNISQPFNFSR